MVRALGTMVARKTRGGEAGIRTLGTLAGTPHFECGAFDHSATSPQRTRGLGYKAIGAIERRRIAVQSNLAKALESSCGARRGSGACLLQQTH